MGNDNKEYYHDKAEQDYQKGKYEKPSGPNDLFTKSSEDFIDDCEAYDKGWDNAKKQDSDSSGCFLTTACVEYAGLTDDCRELQVLRRFRSEYVCNLPNGQSILAEYDQYAPIIVKGIKASGMSSEIFSRLFSTIRKAVSFIETGSYDKAFFIYSSIFKELKKEHCHE
jgi:hypothetical protein